MEEEQTQQIGQIATEKVCTRCGGNGLNGDADIHSSGLCHECEEDLLSQAQPAEDVFKWMDPSSISMHVIPKNVAYELGLKTVFDKSTTQGDLEDAAKRVNKEPQLNATAKASYNLEYLLKFLKTANKVSSYVTIEMASEQPIKISCKTSDNKELRFYLAPYME